MMFVSYDVHMVLLSWGEGDFPFSCRRATLLRRLLSSYVTFDLVVFSYMSILSLSSPRGEGGGTSVCLLRDYNYIE